MADSKISNLNELATAPDAGDLFVIVDVSDTSMSASGTTKKIQSSNVTISDASTTVKGKVELATDAETITGTDTARAVTPANLTAKIDTDGTLFGNLDTRIPSQKAVKTYGDRALNTALTIHPLYAPRGFLINGKIVPSVTSNNLTVALKTIAGTDPSATDPGYIRIGDTVRTISAATSVVANAGSSYLNLGSSELATKEADQFAYACWNSNISAVTVITSRFPGASLISDFTDSLTAEKGYLYTGTKPAAADQVEVIGRFAATLSAGAGYTWSVPTFTAINLIQRPIYETRWLSAGVLGNVTTGIDNGSGGQPTVNVFRYKIINNIYQFHSNLSGTKATTTASIPTYGTSFFGGANITNDDTVGAAFCYAGSTSYVGVVQYYDSGTKYFTATFNASITDNATIRGVSYSGFYEI